MRLKAACEQRTKICTRKNQNALLETAIFYVLLGIGLRKSELVTLNVSQYHAKGLHSVVRHKSKRVTNKVPLPQEAREHLDNYLATRTHNANEPLFINSAGNRINTHYNFIENRRNIMNKSIQMSIKMEPDLHDQFMAAAETVHTPAAQVIRQLMRKFIASLEIPNQATVNAMRSVDKGEGEKFNSAEELFKDWNN